MGVGGVLEGVQGVECGRGCSVGGVGDVEVGRGW